MLFGPKASRNRCADQVKVNLHNEILSLTKVAKNLGLYVDDELRFDKHVNLITKRAFSNIKLIYSNREILNFKSKATLCEALVLSHLNFCDVVYGPCLTKLNCQRLQKIQNLCVRLVFNLKGRHRCLKN